MPGAAVKDSLAGFGDLAEHSARWPPRPAASEMQPCQSASRERQKIQLPSPFYDETAHSNDSEFPG
jgi:hypothetical protein